MIDRKDWPARGEKCGIYAIENTINGKVYIGQAQDIYVRWHNHCAALRKGTATVKLMRAWSKYGAENFRFLILEECPRSMLDAREQAWIDTLDAVASGYNINPTAGSCRGIKQTPERVAKTSKRAMKQWEDPEIAGRMVASVTKTRQTSQYRDERAAQTTTQWKTESRNSMLEGMRRAHHARSPITPEIAKTIQARYVNRCPVNGCTAMAKEFGVALSVISNIVNGKHWAVKP